MQVVSHDVIEPLSQMDVLFCAVGGSQQRRPVLGPSRRRPVPRCRIATVTPSSTRRMTPEAGCFPYRPSIDPLFWLSPGGAERSRPLTGHPIHVGGSSASEGLL